MPIKDEIDAKLRQARKDRDEKTINVIGLIIGCSFSLLFRTHEEPRPLRPV